MTVSIWFDRKVSRCFFAKWREKLPDGKIKYHTQKLVAYSDKYRSKRDVETSPEYLAIVQQIANGDVDSNHWNC